ncbi:MAG: hypothetical protein QOJ56_2821 [Mycobacterium sp.]|jgi:hypothetical protein|uniref:DUF6262 family protein n=1 Tax=Mycobacterium sp. TaxID=1785 RepID=UPI0028B35F4A|nr:hypothetical protein [Mycobacterium sp.]MDT5354289.1 hypothetical protein [Mycobacterium sp.]
MRADNTIHLKAAAARRHQHTRARAIAAMHELDRTSGALTFDSVARHAGVSRSWIYTQPDIKDEIHRLRAQQHRAPIPSSQRASDSSLRQRLELAATRNRELADENQRLRRQLAHALGQLRAAGQPTAGPQAIITVRQQSTRADPSPLRS